MNNQTRALLNIVYLYIQEFNTKDKKASQKMKELLIESKTLPEKVEKFENYFG